METMADRVQRGVALLDQRVPDWRERIDVERLDMAVSAHCVLGQLNGGHRTPTPYTAGLDALGLDYQGGEEHGFELHGRGERADYLLAYVALRYLWVAAIRTV